MKDAICNDNPHILLQLKVAVANLIICIPQNEFSFAFENKTRVYMRVYRHVGLISDICYHLSKYEKCICNDVRGVSMKNVFVLMYRE
jgi:hypothetical protein